jgi:alpha-N-arabinofuranosidase
MQLLLQTIAACVAVSPSFAADRAPFREDFADASAWKTTSPASTARVTVEGLEWRLPPVQPGLYFVERTLPIRVGPSHVISFKVTCDAPTALEVQLGTENLGPRLFHIEQLPSAGTREVRIDVGQMGAFAGFTWQDAPQPLNLRFWIDGGENWAGGTVPRGKELRLVFSDLSVTSPLAGLPDDVGAKLTIDPSKVVRTIHPHVYGHFLEHIYHSVEGGLFGELITNRAFVGPQGFRMEDGVLVQSSMGTDIKTFAGDPNWTDYEFALRARKTGGSEGFLILFRCASDRDFYWWNLGGWGNQRSALEVEANDGRHIAADSTVEGRIESDHWYDIRLRAEGDHLQGWLDGEKLLDVHDATHPKGGVGVGTWATSAEFRDFRVTDLAGKALPVDFAANLKADGTVEAWKVIEPTPEAVTFIPDKSSPNTGIVARLALSDAPGGLSQQPVNIVLGHKYHGVIWMRADGKANVRVALLAQDGTTLAAAEPKPRKTGWQGAEFTLDPKRSDPDATLSITARGEGSLLIDMVSLMRDDSLKTGCRADLLEAVRGLKPPIIRWPGGCFASIFRWKSTLGPQRERKPFYNAPWGEWDSGGFGTDEFIRFCREVGTEPLIVLNLGSWDSPAKVDEYFREALEWIEYCNGDASTPMGKLRAQNGHPEPYNVTHWELDNETWGMGVEAYAERALQFAQAIRERWPDVTLYACTFWEGTDARLLEVLGKEIDLLSYHLYDGPDRFAEAPLGHEAVWRRYEKLIADSPNPKVKLAVTEWNAQSTDWRTGLFAGGLLNVMERCDAVQMASPALFLRRVDATAWDNAFINHDRSGWFPAPNYVVMKLYRDHFQPTLVACESLGGLNANATLSEDGKTLILKVVNPAAEDVKCAIDIAAGFSVKRARQWLVQAGLQERNTLQEPNHIAPVESGVSGAASDFTHVFPAYSVTVMELR